VKPFETGDKRDAKRREDDDAGDVDQVHSFISRNESGAQSQT
jgi:hypothetical protein